MSVYREEKEYKDQSWHIPIFSVSEVKNLVKDTERAACVVGEK